MSLRNLDRYVRGLRDDLEGLRAHLDRGDDAPTYGSFREYVDAATAGRFEWYRHAEILADTLQQVADGELKRALIFMPPRHGKTEEVSRLFPGYFLHRYPERWVGLASYGAHLAHGFSRHARSLFREAGGNISDEASAVSEWETGRGGGLWAAGVGGPLTGRGFHVGIVDDPLKNADEADSELVRDRLAEWWASTFYTRAEPGAAIVVVLTRWHEADLAGWLLEREPEAREGWHIVNFPAVAEDVEPEWPETCTTAPDWREPGEALCPERYPIERLEEISRAIGSRQFAALYQQRPRPRQGLFFREEWFPRVASVPKVARRIRYWDTAGSAGRGDYTVGVLMAYAERTWFVEDVVRGQWSPGRRDRIIQATADKDRKERGKVTIWLEEEAGVAGKERTAETIHALQGFRVRTERVTGSKEDRAEPFAAQAEVGNVRMVQGDWNTAYIDELCGFPHGKHDDQVDASSGAFTKLARASRNRAHSAYFGWGPTGHANILTVNLDDPDDRFDYMEMLKKEGKVSHLPPDDPDHLCHPGCGCPEEEEETEQEKRAGLSVPLQRG